jgi:hypothetical protein
MARCLTAVSEILADEFHRARAHVLWYQRILTRRENGVGKRSSRGRPSFLFSTISQHPAVPKINTSCLDESAGVRRQQIGAMRIGQPEWPEWPEWVLELNAEFRRFRFTAVSCTPRRIIWCQILIASLRSMFINEQISTSDIDEPPQVEGVSSPNCKDKTSTQRGPILIPTIIKISRSVRSRKRSPQQTSIYACFDFGGAAGYSQLEWFTAFTLSVSSHRRYATILSARNFVINPAGETSAWNTPTWIVASCRSHYLYVRFKLRAVFREITHEIYDIGALD